MLAVAAPSTPNEHLEWGLAAISTGRDPCWAKLNDEFVLCLSVCSYNDHEDVNDNEVLVQMRGAESSSLEEISCLQHRHVFFSRKALLDFGAESIFRSFQSNHLIKFHDHMLHTDVQLFLLRAAAPLPQRIELGFRAMVIISQLSHLLSEARSSSVVAKVIALIKSDPFAKHGIRRLASLYMVEPARLENMFLKQQRVRLGAFIRDARLDATRLLVVRSEIPLSHIAFDAGFSSQAHMTTVFKRKYGRTPGELRRMARDEALSNLN